MIFTTERRSQFLPTLPNSRTGPQTLSREDFYFGKTGQVGGLVCANFVLFCICDIDSNYIETRDAIFIFTWW